VQDAKGIGIDLQLSSGNKLFDNVVAACGFGGIHLGSGSNDNLVLNNNSSGNGVPIAGAAADGILVEGGQNDIQGNVANAAPNFCNAGFAGAFCGGLANTTFGDNLMPGPPPG